MSKSQLRSVLDQHVKPLGFARKRGWRYEATDNSSPVQKFIEFRITGGGGYIACDVGMADPKALAFAAQCLKLYGGAVYTYSEWPIPPFNVRCQVGRACGWGLLQSLPIYELGLEETVAKVALALQESIVPSVVGIRDLDQLCRVFLAQDEYFPWLTCNGAMRAAECIYLMVLSGESAAHVAQLLEPYVEEFIQPNLWKGVDARDFLYKVTTAACSSEHARAFHI